MRSLPDGLDQRDVVTALVDGWGFEASTIEYAPLGFGSYHWAVGAPGGDRRFVTVDDLDQAPVDGRDPAFARIRSAFDTAHSLRVDAGLEFVVAPLPTVAGETVCRLGAHHTVALFPYVDGQAGSFGDATDSGDRRDVVDLLVALHGATGIARPVARQLEIGVPGRRRIEAALADLDVPWSGGPFSEPARAWLGDRRAVVLELLDGFDRLAAQVTATAGPRVITHGEPHPGNFVRTPDGLVLVDWDTAGLAPPERDLWMLADEPGHELARYADATGHRPDEAALDMYRRCWDLADLAAYLTVFRSPHDHSEDTEQSWTELSGIARADVH